MEKHGNWQEYLKNKSGGGKKSRVKKIVGKILDSLLVATDYLT